MASHPKFTRITHLVDWNRKLKCTVPGCEKPRQGASHYCSNHLNKVRAHGSVDGRCARIYELRPLMKEVTAMLELNPEHEGLALAERWFQVRIRLAKESTFKFADCFLMLETKPIRERIVRLGALYLLYEREMNAGRSRIFTKHDANLFTNIGSTLLAGLRFNTAGFKRPHHFHLKHLGAAIHKDLGLFFISLARAIDRKALEDAERLRKLGAAWEPP